MPLRVRVVAGSPASFCPPRSFSHPVNTCVIACAFEITPPASSAACVMENRASVCHTEPGQLCIHHDRSAYPASIDSNWDRVLRALPESTMFKPTATPRPSGATNLNSEASSLNLHACRRSAFGQQGHKWTRSHSLRRSFGNGHGDVSSTPIPASPALIRLSCNSRACPRSPPSESFDVHFLAPLAHQEGDEAHRQECSVLTLCYSSPYIATCTARAHWMMAPRELVGSDKRESST